MADPKNRGETEVEQSFTSTHTQPPVKTPAAPAAAATATKPKPPTPEPGSQEEANKEKIQKDKEQLARIDQEARAMHQRQIQQSEWYRLQPEDPEALADMERQKKDEAEGTCGVRSTSPTAWIREPGLYASKNKDTKMMIRLTKDGTVTPVPNTFKNNEEFKEAYAKIFDFIKENGHTGIKIESWGYPTGDRIQILQELAQERGMTLDLGAAQQFMEENPNKVQYGKYKSGGHKVGENVKNIIQGFVERNNEANKRVGIQQYNEKYEASKYILQKHTEKLDGNEKLTAGAVGEEAFKKKLTQDAAGNRLSPAAKDAAMKQELAAMKERQEWSGYAQQALSAQLEAHDKIASDPLTFKKEEEATAADVHNRLDENYLRSEQDRRNAIEALDKEHTDAERRITVMEKEIQAEKVAITNKDPRMRTADDVKRLGELDGMTKNINGIKEKQSELSKQLTGKGVQPSADPNQPNPPSLKEQDTKNMAAIKRKEPKPEPVKASEEERRPGRSISAGGP